MVNAQSEKEIYRKLGDEFCDTLGIISDNELSNPDTSASFLFERISTFFDVRKNEHLHLGIKELHKYYPQENYDTLRNILVRFLARDFITNCINYRKIINYKEIADTTEQQFWLNVCDCMYKEGYSFGSPYMNVLENCKFNVYWGVGYKRDFYGLIYSNNDIGGQWLKINCNNFIEEQYNHCVNSILYPLDNDFSVLNILLKNVILAESVDSLSVFSFEKDAFENVSVSFDNIKDIIQNNSNYSLYQFKGDSIFYIVNYKMESILFGIDFKYDLFERKIVKFVFLPRENIKKIKKLEQEFVVPPPPPVKKIIFLPPVITSDELPPSPSMQEPIIPSAPPK